MKNALVVVAILVVALAAGAAAQPPVEPPAPQMILDNRSVRVTVVTYPPGVGTGRHQGIEAEVGVVVEGDLVLESPQGRTVLRPGSGYWLPGLTPHDTRNETGRPARTVEILLKRCD